MSKDFNIISDDFFNKNMIKNIPDSYNVLLCDNDFKIKNMIKKFNEFIAKITNHSFIGMDFEFNRSDDNTKREIALFQIHLQHKNKSSIYLFYPFDLNDSQKDVLKKLLLNKTVKKIIHGGESLDIPFLFNNFFTESDEQIEFCKNLYDTKYLCEYFNYENNNIDYKCKIYYLLKQMNIVTEKQFDYLLKNEEDMGPIYNIKIKVSNMSKELINYCTYDVLYLVELYKVFPKNNFYQNLIPEITSIHFILKQTDFFKNYSEIISKYNNYFFKLDNISIKLIDYYQYMYYWIIDKNLYSLLQITYFKKFFQIIIKFLVYSIVLDNYEIYLNKYELNQESISTNNLLLNIKEFNETNKLVNIFSFKIKKEISI